MSRLAVGAALGAAATLIVGVPVVAVAVLTFTAAPTIAANSTCERTIQVEQNGTPVVAGFNRSQVANATIIVRVGQQMGVPPRGWVIAVATAMQESRLTNLGHLGDRNDHDSQGLFQQRPSQGWGTVAQIRDPQYAARKFYEKLVQVPAWAGLPLTVAAQKVQRSAFPSAYAKHETNAARIVDAVAGGAANSGSTENCATGAEVTASGWTNPVAGKVGSGFRTSERPSHNGVDVMAARGTVVRAVASGTVLRSLCDAGTLETVGTCDRDGHPNARGCGWYVDLRHADRSITRYCHFGRKPLVAVGQAVTVGQQLGVVGSSGRSSGPHLHFETHVNDDRSSAGAVEPVAFMRSRGVNLNG